MERWFELRALTAGRRRAVLASLRVLAALVAASVAVVWRAGAWGADSGALEALGVVVSIVAAALVFARVRLLARARLAWSLIALAMVLAVASNAYYSVVVMSMNPQPYPSWSDAGWLAFYPLAYASIALQLRMQVARWHASTWLDGLVAACGLGALAIALVFRAILAPGNGGVARVATALAYPVGDLLLIVLVVGALGVLGWRAGAMWWLLIGGLTAIVLGDAGFLVQSAADAYEPGSWLDLTWIVGAALAAAGAWVRQSERPRREIGDWALLAVPLLFAATSIALLTIGSLRAERADPLVTVLASATICLALARTTLTLREVRSLGEARRQARTDDLTGLPNRRAFLEELAISDATSTHALLLIDLDRFKDINDSFGHSTGDQMLRMVGPRLTRVLPERAVLARLGGDEFGVLLPAADHATASRTARELNLSLREAFVLDSMPLHVEASIGIALAPTHGTSTAVLLQRADLAMYKAKRSGAGYTVYEPGDAGDARDRMQTLEELRTALETGQLVLHFQPKLELTSGTIVGAEALVRWQHPVRGLVYPDAFLPLAEQSGLMGQIAHQVLDKSLTAVASWRAAGHDLHVAVNLSASDLRDAALASHVHALLTAHALPPEALVLEITENILMVDAEHSQHVLAKLRGLGVRLAVDDYGTGYSSLAYLHELPVDELKLDRSFVTHLATDSRAAAIVDNTIALAHALGMVILAEGVEDAHVQDALATWRCDLAQGYHIARPMTAELFQPWLEAHARPRAPDGDLPLATSGR